ncbi:MAG: hypothetical protein COA43_10870 [Robiginitomaculum sp.]|nr:MAG: hypothetical protein COA43_10870 [Robiginitomaculum sp.]
MSASKNLMLSIIYALFGIFMFLCFRAGGALAFLGICCCHALLVNKYSKMKPSLHFRSENYTGLLFIGGVIFCFFLALFVLEGETVQKIGQNIYALSYTQSPLDEYWMAAQNRPITIPDRSVISRVVSTFVNEASYYNVFYIMQIFAGAWYLAIFGWSFRSLSWIDKMYFDDVLNTGKAKTILCVSLLLAALPIYLFWVNKKFLAFLIVSDSRSGKLGDAGLMVIAWLFVVTGATLAITYIRAKGGRRS